MTRTRQDKTDDTQRRDVMVIPTPSAGRTATANEWTRLLIAAVAAAVAAGCLALPFTLPGTGPTAALAGAQAQVVEAASRTGAPPPA